MIDRRRLSLGILTVPALLGGGCTEQDRTFKTAVSVLIDLSETWHNPASDAYNERLLKVVGGALVAAAPHMTKPITVRYHAIGSQSLGVEALCTADYRPKVFRNQGDRREPNLFTHREELSSFLIDQCSRTVLTNRVAEKTDISAAIVTAVRSMGLAPRAQRTLIILSDFKEEGAPETPFAADMLQDVRVVLIYRVLPEDRARPAGLDTRINSWKSRLAACGADVIDFAEGAVASPQQLATVITKTKV